MNDKEKANLIINVICNHFDLPIKNLLKKDRHQRIATMRQIIQYFIKKYTDIVLVEIAVMTGVTNHATVIYSLRKIEKEIAENKKFTEHIGILKDKIEFEFLRNRANLDIEGVLNYLIINKYPAVVEARIKGIRISIMTDCILFDDKKICDMPVSLKELKKFINFVKM